MEVQMETVQTETPVKFGKLSKCEHEGCICTVSTGERFCSDYCAEQASAAAASTDDDCNCGHAECVHAVISPKVGAGFTAT